MNRLMTKMDEILVWKREYWSQRDRYDGIGPADDLATEWALRDAEYARNEARALYRQKLLALWDARRTYRMTMDAINAGLAA